MMLWDDIYPLPFREGEILTYATENGVYLEAEIVKVICPVCLERFVGNKREAGGFISGHQIYHQYIEEIAESYGGV